MEAAKNCSVSFAVEYADKTPVQLRHGRSLLPATDDQNAKVKLTESFNLSSGLAALRMKKLIRANPTSRRELPLFCEHQSKLPNFFKSDGCNDTTHLQRLLPNCRVRIDCSNGFVEAMDVTSESICKDFSLTAG